MTYNKSMVFIETAYFTHWITDYLKADEYRELQNYLIENPEVGDIIRGSGGIRKLPTQKMKEKILMQQLQFALRNS
jgi:hypothetical protein